MFPAQLPRKAPLVPSPHRPIASDWWRTRTAARARARSYPDSPVPAVTIARGSTALSIRLLRRRRMLRKTGMSGLGQSVVEFALALPVLLLILLLAIDFARLFFGYVILTNSARIAANFAAANATDPFGAGSDYDTQIRADLNTANCTVAGPLPTPVFVDGGDSGPGDTARDAGDSVSVGLECTFDPFVFPDVRLAADATFPVRDGAILGAATQPPVAPPPVPPPCPAGQAVVPDLVNPSPQRVDAARAEWAAAGFTGTFNPPTGSNGKTVLTQSLAASSCQSTTAPITVTHT